MFGTSRVLAVGPVAVVSLMTATAIGEHAVAGTPGYAAVAITLAFLSGAMLVLMGLLRLGFLAHFLSHPVISGFITASALLIAAGQLKVILGLQVPGHDFGPLVWGMAQQAGHIHAVTAALGLGTVAFLFWARRGLQPLLVRLGLRPRLADVLAKAGPVVGIAITAWLTWRLQLQAQGLKIVGTVPQGLPPLTLPVWNPALWKELAVLSRVDRGVFKRTWAYSKADFAAVLATVLFTLAAGLEAGLIAGVLLSIAPFLVRTSPPHIAEVGLKPGNEHFRNALRHAVAVSPRLLSLRVDESLYFANARALEDRISDELAQWPELQHVVLQCSAINDIDASALESLEAIDRRLADAGVLLHFSEVKGPVMDRLQGTPLLAHLRGRVLLTHFQALQQLAP